MRLTFTVPGEPKAKARPRVVSRGGRTIAYTPRETALYENMVKLSFTEQNAGKTLTGPLSAYICAYFPIPKSVSKKKRIAMEQGILPHTKRPDSDNIAKTILDAINGIAYHDDSAVCELTVCKKYSDHPRVEVILEELDETI